LLIETTVTFPRSTHMSLLVESLPSYPNEIEHTCPNLSISIAQGHILNCTVDTSIEKQYFPIIPKVFTFFFKFSDL
jgi:hypothetical protein